MRESAEPVRENLKENGRRLLREQEIRIGHIAEAAEEYLKARAGEGADSFAALFAAEEVPALTPVVLPADAPEENRPLLRAAVTWQDTQDRIAFSDAFLQAAEIRFGRSVRLSDFPDGSTDSPRGERIAYVRNPQTDRAFAAFSRLFRRAAVLYSATFREVCDELDDGHASFAILPIAAAGSPMATPWDLIRRYGFRLAAVCRVPSGESETVMALLCRETVLLGDPTAFCFGFTPKTPLETAGILAAAAHNGLRLLSESAVPNDYEGEGLSARMTFAGDAVSFAGLLTYLTLFVPGFTGYGLYLEIEEDLI